ICLGSGTKVGSTIAKTEEVCALLLLGLPRGLRVGADGTNHRYEEGDHVPLPVCQQGPSHGDRKWKNQSSK
ncbi:unnamed protein product, partial [Musa acuminata var. zebrina]